MSFSSCSLFISSNDCSIYIKTKIFQLYIVKTYPVGCITIT